MLSREELLEMADKEVAVIARADFDNPEQMARARGHARAVLDEHGRLIQMLPGTGELKENSLGSYKKQMRAALKGTFSRRLRSMLDRLTGSNKQAILDHSHALKQNLRADWKRFYANALVGENNAGLLMHLAEKGDIDESYIEELARRTGWVFNRNPLQIYETGVEQASKQALVKGGGLYRIILEIRPGEFRTFFAKKHGKKDEYERTVKAQPLLAEITDKVSPVIAKDSHNDITIENYINGETLTQMFRRITPQSEFTQHIKDPAIRAEHEKLEQDLCDKERSKFLIPALDELIEISGAVEKNRNRFGFLRALGKGGKSFTEWFKEKYKPNDAGLIALIEKNITSYMDSEDTVFCHGDAHTDNVIEKLHEPHWIDWEYAGFSIPQWDVVKLLKKAGLSHEAEQDIVGHVCEKRRYDDKERFRAVYHKAKIFDALASAAKYHKLSFTSKKHRASMRAQADIYFTDALRLIEEDKKIDENEKAALVKALEKDARGKLSRLADEEYKRMAKELDPYRSPSMENFGTPSIMEKYSLPPLSERIGKLWKKHKLKAAAGIAFAAASIAGAFVYADAKAEQARLLTKIQRTSQYYTDTERNEKLMPFVSEYARKYDNLSEEELAAVINAAYKYNRKNADFLLDHRQNPEPWAHEAGAKQKKEAVKLKDGLSEEQSFVKEEHLEDPENNVFAAAKKLSEMKKEFKNIEDAILAFYTSPEFVRKWKKGRSYWDYSKEKEFGWDMSFKADYKTLTDMAVAYLKK